MKAFLLVMLALMVWCQASAQMAFSEIDTNFSSRTVVIPGSPVKHDVLFIGNYHQVYTTDYSDSTLAKDWHDYLVYLPLNSNAPSDSGIIVVNHEMIIKNEKLGDGGGMTAFKARRKMDGSWEMYEKFRNIDFSTVGGTLANCGGGVTRWGTIMTAEEWNQSSNRGIYENGMGITDTSDYIVKEFNGTVINRTIKKYQNFNWMVEVDPVSGKALRKLYNMGRYDHESAVVMPDEKTVYLTDDNSPAVFFKFVADAPRDLSKGQLYAYRQDISGNGGSWVALPMDFDSMLNARTVALNRGATMFIRLEWATLAKDGKIYFTETGRDSVNFRSNLNRGFSLAKHLRDLDAADSKTDSIVRDYYGRVLVFDPTTNTVRPHVNGGTSPTNNAKNLSNPDGLDILTIDNKQYLMIQEDLNGLSRNRVPAGNTDAYCEMYLLDLDIENPTIDDCKRFLSGPRGIEVTGAYATPDGNTIFVNLQHPDAENPFPYNNSVTIAVNNIRGLLTSLDKTPVFEKDKNSLEVFPNPASRVIYLNKTTDVCIYDQSGKRVLVERGVNQVDISALSAGSYFVQSIENEIIKLILE